MTFADLLAGDAVFVDANILTMTVDVAVHHRATEKTPAPPSHARRRARKYQRR